MNLKYTTKLIVAVLLSHAAMAQANQNQQGQSQQQNQNQQQGQQNQNQNQQQNRPRPPEFQSVSTTDTQVREAAEYAAKQMHGSLVNVTSAGRHEDDKAVIYRLKMKVNSDAKGQASSYVLDVCIPKENIPWRVKNVRQIQ